jgi:hypothetical protein
MDSYMSYIGFAGSALSMLTTFYFWTVRVRNERPRLQSYLMDRELFLGLARDDMRQIGVKVGVIVANYSSLPNAILGARAWIRLRSGWAEVENVAFDKQTPPPFNVPPLQTVMLRLSGTLTFAYDEALEDGSKTLTNYLALLAEPFEIKVELRHLRGAGDAHSLQAPAGSERAGTAPRRSAA